MWFLRTKLKKSEVTRETIDAILDLMKMLRVDIVTLKAEVESIQGKLRKKIYKKEDDSDEEKEETKDIYRGVLLPDR